MLKRIRDFIYDINDIFVAVVILLAAAGIIIWRSSVIMAYPDYLAAKEPSANTENVDFSGIDLTPEKVENINENLEIIEPSETDPNEGTDAPNGGEEQNQGGETTPGPNGGEEQNQGGETTPDPNGGEQQGQEGSQDGTVTATVTVDATKETWPKVVNKLIAAGLMKEEERKAFMAKLAELKLDTKLMPGTYTLTNTSYEDMIKVLCRQH